MVEYSAHMIPELGVGTMPSLYTDNFLVAGDAGAFVINHGYSYRGVDLAVLSGASAADAVIAARQRGDYSRMGLSTYPEMLKRNGVMPDMVKFQKAPVFLQNARLFTTYPKMVCNFFDKMYAFDGKGKDKIFEMGKKEMLGKVSILKMLKDAMGAFKSM